MVKTRSGKHYNTAQLLLETKLMNAKEKIANLEQIIENLVGTIENLQDRVDKTKDNYVSVLQLLVNRQANHRLLTLCIDKLHNNSKPCAAQPREESECCVCYEKNIANIKCVNGHSMCLSCLTSWNWSNRGKDFMESTTCPCCRKNFISIGRDNIYDLAGINFANTQVRIT